MNWLCKLLGHKFRYIKPWFYCERCDLIIHNPRVGFTGIPPHASTHADGGADEIAMQLDPATMNADGHISIICLDVASVGDGIWTRTVNSSQILGFFLYNSSNADGNNVSWNITLSKGTYSMTALFRRGPNNGIVDIDIGTTEVHSEDTYHTSTSYNWRATATGISIASSGRTTIRARVDGKNASSGGYYCEITAIILWRTA